MLPLRDISPPFHVTLLALGVLLNLTACGPVPAEGNQAASNQHSEAVKSGSNQGDSEVFQVGEASIPVPYLENAIAQLGQSFSGFGHDTLAWYLLDGGIGPAAVLHHRFGAESLKAKELADSVAKKLGQGESFYTLYQEHDGDPAPPTSQQPSPFALGGRISAAVATMQEEEWAGPFQTIKGWEVFLLESRTDALPSVAGIRLRTILFPVGDSDDRRQAREDWAKLPLSGNAQVIRSLPAAFRRGRVVTAPSQ